MKITVTHYHISRGRRDDPQFDPVALAISEATGFKPHVGASAVIIDGSSYNLPRSVRRFIEKFDDGLGVEPIEFELRVRV